MKNSDSYLFLIYLLGILIVLLILDYINKLCIFRKF